MYYFRLPAHFPPERVLGYYRVSTSKQEKHGHALERYREQLLAFGVPEANIYYDVESGGSTTRDGFNRILERCHQDAIAIVVPELSRFQRSVLIGENVRQLLAKLNTQFIEADTGKIIDLFSADGIREWQSKNTQAEYIRNMAAQHSIRGHAHRRQQEKPLVARFGYLIENNQYVFNYNPYRETGKTCYEVAREAIELFKELKSYSKPIGELCRKYGYKRVSNRAWEDFPRDHSSFKGWISSKVLRGHIVYFPNNRCVRVSIFQEEKREIVLFNRHEPLIKPEEDLFIQKIIGAIAVGRKPDTPINPLAGKLFCAGCGCGMESKTTAKHYHYLVCRGAYPRNKPRTCDRRSSYGLQVKDAVEAVIAALCDRSLEIAQWGCAEIEEVADSPEIIIFREKIAQLQSLQDPDLIEIIALKQSRLNQLLDEKRLLNFNNSDRIERLQTFAQDPNFWRFASVTQQQTIFAELVERVECDRGNLSVKLLI